MNSETKDRLIKLVDEDPDGDKAALLYVALEKCRDDQVCEVLVTYCVSEEHRHLADQIKRRLADC